MHAQHLAVFLIGDNFHQPIGAAVGLGAAQGGEGKLSHDDIVAEPISADEMLHVHELLVSWKGGFSELLTPRPERQPK